MICEDAMNSAKRETVIHNRHWLDSPWDGFFDQRDPMEMPETGVAESELESVSEAISAIPEEPFVIHGGTWLIKNCT